jgi:Ca2+:H+ antiporter
MEFLRKVGWLNLLLVFVPIALVLEWTHSSALWIFAASSVAIIPLAGLMGKSTEMLAERLGPGIGGLLNASFGNAAELIIAFFALKAGLLGVVKASIAGSILGNVLLVLGASLLAGGIYYRQQTFNATAAGLAATMLALAAVGLLVPELFHSHLVAHHQTAPSVEQDVSLEISIVLFVTYMLMLLFNLKTHKHLYEAGHHGEHQPHYSEAEPLWSVRVSVSVLLVATALVALMSETLVGAVEEARERLGWTELFVGVIVIAVVGNAAEHSTAILVAMKNQMDLSFQIAVGSGLQIALFVAPLLVFLSYLPGMPRLNLLFTMMEVAAILASVIIVGFVALDGESNWMEGLLLLAVYVILAIAFFNLPEDPAAEHAPAEQVSFLSGGRNTDAGIRFVWQSAETYS